jgi:CBS-domain-containing membrane protein
MNVADVMTKVLVTVRSDAYLQEAAALMVQHCVSGLPVVDETGTLIGLITEGDLIRRAELGTAGAQPGWLSIFLNPGRAAREYVRTHGRKVGEIMTREVITTSPNAPLSAIVDIMESQQVKRLPVLQNQRLVGIVSRADLLRALAQLLPERNSDPIGRLAHDVSGDPCRSPMAPAVAVELHQHVAECRQTSVRPNERTTQTGVRDATRNDGPLQQAVAGPLRNGDHAVALLGLRQGSG